MLVKYKKSEHKKFCYTDLCNTPAKASELIKNKCEGDNNSIDSKQLIYSRQILNPNSTNKVTECNFCLIMILKTNFYLTLVLDWDT